MTQLFEIIETVYVTSPFDGHVSTEKKVVAVCSTKNKAIAKLKELANDPPCSQPTVREYDEELEMAFLENKHGWRADYKIEEIILDEWID